MMETLLEHYNKGKIPENEQDIEKTFALMGKVGWTECDRTEFEHEIESIISKKEKEL